MYPQPTPKAKNRSDDGQTNGQTIRGAEEDCRQQGIAFFPLVAESLGGWHKVLKERSGNLGVRLLGTLGNWRVKPFPTSGGDLASSSNGEMLQFWATGFPTSPILKWTESSEISIL